MALKIMMMVNGQVKIAIDDNDEKIDKYITKHFDFRLDGNINGRKILAK